MKLLLAPPAALLHCQQQSRRDPASSAASVRPMATGWPGAPQEPPITNCASACERTLARPAWPGARALHDSAASANVWRCDEENARKQWSLPSGAVHSSEGHAAAGGRVLAAVRESVALGDPVPEALGVAVPEAVGEMVPVMLDDLEPVGLDERVAVALSDPVPVGLGRLDAEPLIERVLEALDGPVLVALDEPVPVCELDSKLLPVSIAPDVADGGTLTSGATLRVTDSPSTAGGSDTRTPARYSADTLASEMACSIRSDSVSAMPARCVSHNARTFTPELKMCVRNRYVTLPTK